MDFYELALNVKGLPTLEASLDDYLSIEHLAGDNQFFCESCNARVDATHCSKLRSLPPVLNFQLKRFVYDAKVQSIPSLWHAKLSGVKVSVKLLTVLCFFPVCREEEGELKIQLSRNS